MKQICNLRTIKKRRNKEMYGTYFHTDAHTRGTKISYATAYVALMSHLDYIIRSNKSSQIPT